MTRWVPALVFAVLAVVLFAPATLGGKVLAASDLPLYAAPFTQPAGKPQNPLQYDAAFVFEPDGLQVREALRDGHLPTWSPWMSAGRPLLAAQQSAPLFPLTWIGAVFPYWQSLAWIAVLELVLAGWGTVVLGRLLGLRLGAALLGGIAFAFGSYLVNWLMHPHANAYVLLPWLFVLGELVCRRGRLRDAAGLAAVFGVAWLGGQPESAALVTLATVAWIAYRLLAGREAVVRRGALAAGALAAGLALAAVMLLPLKEALDQASATTRSGPPLPLSAVGSVVFPDYWGRPDRATEILGPANFTERTLYIGVLPTLLAVAGLVARRPRGPQLFFALLAAVTLVLALDTGPLPDLVYGLPGFDRINLARIIVLASFAGAMLAAFGLERLLAATPAERRRMLIAVGVLAALPVVAAIVAQPSRLGAIGGAIDQLLARGTPGADGVTLAAVLRWAVIAALAVAVLTRRRWVVPAACLLAALDLLWMGWGFNPAITKAQAEPAPTRAIAALRDLTAGGGRVVGIDGLEPNTASRWQLADARGHEQPSVRRTLALWYGLGGSALPSTEAVNPAEPRTPKLLDLFGMRAVLLAPGTQAPALRADPVAHRGPDGVVLEHRTALPAAYVAYGWRPSRSLGDSVLGVALGDTALARNAPVIETADRPPAGAPPPATAARITGRTATSVTVDVRALRPGRLVLLDTFYPGWEATVDGRPATIEAANAAFRAVAVGAGRHEVRFAYKPASVRNGAIVSVAALVLLVSCLLLPRAARSWRGRRGRTPPRSANQDPDAAAATHSGDA
jgi:Bacterial membrane protein YfhO